jgi:hypothetical protein
VECKWVLPIRNGCSEQLVDGLGGAVAASVTDAATGGGGLEVQVTAREWSVALLALPVDTTGRERQRMLRVPQLLAQQHEKRLAHWLRVRSRANTRFFQLT